jgi:streptogramin lyase
LTAWAPVVGFYSNQTVASLVIASPEAQAHLVAGLYQNYLHRAGSSSEINAFIAYLQQGVHVDLSKRLFLAGDQSFDPVRQDVGQFQLLPLFCGSDEFANQAMHGIGCPFDDNLTGWTVRQEGGSAAGQGTVVGQDCQAILREGDSFNVTLQKQITIPDQPSVLTFSYADLAFNTPDPNSIQDAFEAALVASDPKPLVHTIAAGRDAFFNITEGQAPVLGADASQAGQTVTVDLSALAPGSSATLIFRLVNNDGLGSSSVHLTNFQIQPGGDGQPLGAVPALESRFTRQPLDFSLLSDVSSSFQTLYGQTSFNEDSNVLHARLAVHNAGTYFALAPLLVGIAHLSDPSVQVRGTDGVTPDGIPYYDFSSLVAGGSLAPGQTTGARTLQFFNPHQKPFTYDLVFLAELNQSPVFTSQPNTEAIPGVPYAYQATTSDADHDTPTYSLLTGPAGMQLDRVSGKVTWSPGQSDLGTHVVALRVDDGRGGSAEQHYTISAIVAPPNRPPVFTSQPVVTANVDAAYRYQATASDPDGETLTFSVVSGPQGLAIDPASGLVTWAPTADQVGANNNVTLQVSDGQLTATQTYVVCVDQQVGNHAPVIISTPVTSFSIPPIVQSQGGSIFITGHDADFHASDFPGNLANPQAAQDILRRGLEFTRHGSPKPFLWVESRLPGDPRTGPGKHGLIAAGFVEGVDFVHVDASQLPSVRFEDYSTIAVASDYGGVLTQAELDALNARAGDIAAYVSAGGGLFALAESGQEGAHTTSHQYGFLPFVPSAIPVGQSESGATVTPFGQSLGLVASDVNGNVSHNVFLNDAGMQVVDRDPAGEILSLAYRGRLTLGGVLPGTPYTYPLRAIDADNDPVTYSLTKAPPGMTIDPHSGVISWNAAPTFLAGAVHFFDGDFNPSNWETQLFAVDPSTASGSATQVFSGGNPGAYRQVSFRSGQGLSVGVFNGRLDATYNPQQQGAIDTLDYGEDVIQLGSPAFSGGIALRQDGKVYVSNLTNSKSRAWTPQLVRDLTAVDFIRAVSSKPDFGLFNPDEHPDFSAGGAPIEFGFFRWDNSANDWSMGIDNWSVTVRPVRPQAVGVKAVDGRGGVDTQDFNIGFARPAQIQGLAFNDLNGNSVWDRRSDLLVSAGGLSRFDANSGVLIDQTPMPGSVPFVHNIARGPDGAFYYAGLTNDIVRLDPTTGAVTPFASGQGLDEPNFVTFGPDGNLYVTNVGVQEPVNPFGGVGSVSRFDGHTGAFLGTFASGFNFTWDLGFGPDGNLYVDSANDGRVVRLDAQTGARTGSFGTPGGTGALTFGPDGKLYVLSSDDVVRYDITTGTSLGEFVTSHRGGLQNPGGAYGLAFGPDGSLYVSSSGTDQVLRYNGQTGAFMDVFASFDEAHEPRGLLFVPRSTLPQEPGVAGVTVFIDQNGTGHFDPSDRFTTTDANGHYVLDGLAPGTYRVVQELPPGFNQSLPATRAYTVTVGEGQTAYQIDFGEVQKTTTTQELPPAFSSTAPTAATVCQLFRYDPVANDPDGDPLTFDMPVKPAGMVVDPQTGVVVWFPTAAQVGPQPVVLRVQDGHGGIDLQSFTVAVSQPNTAPGHHLPAPGAGGRRTALPVPGPRPGRRRRYDPRPAGYRPGGHGH